MNRREMLVGAGALAMATRAFAAPTKENKAPPAAHVHDAGLGSLVEAAADCARRAEACLSHCLTLLATGDTSMAGCAMAVRETAATSRALMTLASSGSKFAKPLAKLCADVCRDCEAECRKHQDKHTVCKECADACARMIAECAKA